VPLLASMYWLGRNLLSDAIIFILLLSLLYGWISDE